MVKAASSKILNLRTAARQNTPARQNLHAVPDRPVDSSVASPVKGDATAIVAIDNEINELSSRLQTLMHLRKVTEFSANPEAYEKKLLAKFQGLSEVRNKENPFNKPSGSYRSTSAMIMEVFEDYPFTEFSAGTMLSKIVDRGWVTRSRAPANIITMIFCAFANNGKIQRVAHGIYRYSQSSKK